MFVAFYHQYLIASIVFTVGEDLADVPADHQLDQLCLAHIGYGAIVHQRAVSENRVVVGNPENFIEFVADEKDSLALRFQPFDKFIKFFDFLLAERGGRLVHYHHARVDRKRAGNRHEMLVCNPQVFEFRSGIDVGTNGFQDLASLVHHRSCIDQAETPAWCVAQKHVFCHRQFIE